jgi:cytochrome c oxidase assembly protein subunit 11
MDDRKKNLSLALNLAAIALGMVMLAYASVPLYRVFCQATGFGGKAKVAVEKAHSAINRTMEVRFDANVSPEIDWAFKPLQTKVDVKIGADTHIAYLARNKSDRTLTGTATFNITPTKAGVYFNKIQCFCFTEQTLKPGEEKRLDVTFFIDPAINDDRDLDDIRTITLSYTFFPLKK